MLIPWAEVVALKKRTDEALLTSIDLYLKIAADESQTAESREMAAGLVQKYKRMYLNIEPKGAL